MLTIPNGGLTLGNNNGGQLSLNDYLNIGPGGCAVLGSSGTAGSLQLGTGNNQIAETDSVNLTGGQLFVTGSIVAASGTGQSRTFAWTGGQLTTYTITPGPGFAASGSLGGISPTALVNTSGTLAPGDIGIAGQTYINGNFVNGPSGAVAIDIGGIIPAAGYQNPLAGYYYDDIAVTGTSTLSGTLQVSIINGYVPSASQSYTILTSGTLSGNFANLTSGTRVISTDGGSSFLVSSTGNAITLKSYLPVTPPVITSQPASATVLEGSSVAFVVSASASAITPNTYQWYLGGAPILGATASIYSIASAQAANAGSYVVVVANTAGSVVSSTATLTVILPPNPPATVSATAGNAQVTLSWSSSPGATSYNVARGTVSGSYSSVFSGIASTGYLDTNVSNETTYYYVVAASGTAGTGAASTEVSARPVLPWGSKETVAPAIALTSGTPTATVSTVAGRTYQLQRSDTLQAGSWINIGSPMTGTGSPAVLSDPSSAGANRHFYRVQITQ